MHSGGKSNMMKHSFYNVCNIGIQCQVYKGKVIKAWFVLNDVFMNNDL